MAPARASSRKSEAGVAGRAWGRAVDSVFPPRCLLCGGECEAGHRGQVCAACVASLPAIRGPACERCGIELVSECRVCMRCRDRTDDLARSVALFPYLGTVRELVHLYKAAGHRSVAVLFASLLAEAYRREYDGLPLVPVPGRRAVRRRRGWEHVDLLATILERQHGIPVTRCLARRRGNVQKALDFDGRLRNIAGKYVLRAPGPKRAILLDDVLTTGATLSECARILKQSGSAWVGALTIAVDE